MEDLFTTLPETFHVYPPEQAAHVGVVSLLEFFKQHGWMIAHAVSSPIAHVLTNSAHPRRQITIPIRSDVETTWRAFEKLAEILDVLPGALLYKAAHLTTIVECPNCVADTGTYDDYYICCRARNIRLYRTVQDQSRRDYLLAQCPLEMQVQVKKEVAARWKKPGRGILHK